MANFNVMVSAENKARFNEARAKEVAENLASNPNRRYQELIGSDPEEKVVIDFFAQRYVSKGKTGITGETKFRIKQMVNGLKNRGMFAETIGNNPDEQAIDYIMRVQPKLFAQLGLEPKPVTKEAVISATKPSIAKEAIVDNLTGTKNVDNKPIVLVPLETPEQLKRRPEWWNIPSYYDSRRAVEIKEAKAAGREPDHRGSDEMWKRFFGTQKVAPTPNDFSSVQVTADSNYQEPVLNRFMDEVSYN